LKTAALVAAWLCCCALSAGGADVHPLEPLSAAEIKQAAELLRARQPANDLYFPLLTLREPTKQELSEQRAGRSIPRRAAAVIRDHNAHKSYEATVDLAAQKVTAWKELVGIQPTVLLGEYKKVTDIVRANEKWQAAMRKRDIEDFTQVNLDAWAPGYLTVAGAEHARLMRVLSFFRGTGTNAYGRPIEGVVAIVNLDADDGKGKVIEIIDTGIVPIAKDGGTDFFDEDAVDERPAPKPLVISQPEGVSFEVQGNEVRWQKWRFRYSLHPREGLVLHTIGYEDGAENGPKVRPILHRASVAEMVVPYGEAAANWNWRSAFDQGEYGLGRTSNKLTLGEDVPANAKLFDTVFANDLGEAYVHERSVGIYEQDGGILWKHYDETSEKVIVRRARQLVIGTVTTIGNYDYGINWIFHQDGTLEARVDLTGILLAKGVTPQQCEKCAAAAAGKSGEATGDQRYGTLVGKSIVAPNHQHIFSFRLDFDVDGGPNSALETSVKPAPAGEGNPADNAFVHSERLLKTEQEARRNLDLSEHRRWKIINSGKPNELGHFPGYLLEPGANCIPKLGPSSITRKRAGYIANHLWITRHKDDELHAAGNYPRQRAAGEGLPQWSGDESIENEDLVMWYTMTVTHVPRAEEWPVMSAAHSGFSLVPVGFFTRNPALDVPASK
jgi:primary-amine oxidase